MNYGECNSRGNTVNIIKQDFNISDLTVMYIHIFNTAYTYFRCISKLTYERWSEWNLVISNKKLYYNLLLFIFNPIAYKVSICPSHATKACLTAKANDISILINLVPLSTPIFSNFLDCINTCIF